MKRSIILAAIVALAGCTYETGLEAGKPAALTSAQAQAVNAGVKAVLKDPGSATISGLRAADLPEGVKFVCGYVNAKNSYGGYGGPAPFYGHLYDESGVQSFRGVSVGNPAEENYGIRVVCRDRGAPL